MTQSTDTVEFHLWAGGKLVKTRVSKECADYLARIAFQCGLVDMDFLYAGSHQTRSLDLDELERGLNELSEVKPQQSSGWLDKLTLFIKTVFNRIGL